MSVRSFVRPSVCPLPLSKNNIQSIISPYKQLHHNTHRHTQHQTHNITHNITHKFEVDNWHTNSKAMVHYQSLVLSHYFQVQVAAVIENTYCCYNQSKLLCSNTNEKITLLLQRYVYSPVAPLVKKMH